MCSVLTVYFLLATSTAPSVGSKRRFTDDDDGGGGEERAMLPPTSPVSPGFDPDNLPSLRVKRQRVVDVQVQGGDENKAEEEGVKEVTEGVREVDITSQSSDNKDVLEDDVERQGDETSLDNVRLEKEKEEKEEKEEEKEEEGEEEASNVPLPDSPLLLPLPEQSLTPTSLVDPLATEPVECRGFEGGEAEADVDEGEVVGEDGVDGDAVVDVEDVVPKTVADVVAPGESASAIDASTSTLTATTIPLETTTTATTTTTSVAPPSQSSS